MKLSEDLFEAYQDDPDYNPNFNEDKYGKYFDEDGKLKPELADEYFALTDGVNESLNESADDGWPEELANDPIIEKLDKFTYEMKHAVRGAYTGAKTLSDLFNYVGDLIDEMNEFEDYIEYLSSTNESLKKNLTEALEDQYEDLYDQIYCNLTMSGSPVISNVIKGVYKSWENSHIFFEHYEDGTGKGTKNRPFNGWTSLIVAIISEKYEIY